jgi:hypothetical protein
MTTPGAPRDVLSCRRIVPIPFAACVAALDSWQLTRPGRERRFGPNVLRGPAEHDHRLGTWRIEVRLARGPLRPPVRMQLHIDHWSATATAIELIPCQRVSPTGAYFRAGRALLDDLTCALRAHTPVPRLAGVPPRQNRAAPAATMPPRRTRPAAGSAPGSPLGGRGRGADRRRRSRTAQR